MKHGFKRIMLALSLAFILSIPTQTFAMEKITLNSLIPNNFCTITLPQLTKQSMDRFQMHFVKHTKHKIHKVKRPTAVYKAAVPKSVNKSTPITTTPKPPVNNINNTTTPIASINNYEQKVLELVNKERNAAGLASLTMNNKLTSVAEKKAADMRDGGYFSHTSPTYGSPFDMMHKFGITYSYAGENIAKGQRTPEEVMNGWMNSQGHRANILNANYTQIGIGYVTHSNGTGYWVQEFIRP